jgi:hypothetical protein
MEDVMMQFEDFTALPRGFEAPLEGRVTTCPRCGRNGIEEHPACGEPFFLHRQATDLQPDGMRVEPFDCCALSPN